MPSRNLPTADAVRAALLTIPGIGVVEISFQPQPQPVRSASRRSRLDRDILATLAGGPKSAKQIARALSRESVSNHFYRRLAVLEADGAVKRSRQGVWGLITEIAT